MNDDQFKHAKQLMWQFGIIGFFIGLVIGSVFPVLP